MSGLKKFLDRRSRRLAEKQAKKDESSVKDPTEKKEEKEVVEDPNLTDDEFWEISNKFLKERRRSDKDLVEILQEILSQYPPLKIKQFAKRYEELNS